MSYRINKDLRNLSLEALLAGSLVTIPCLLFHLFAWDTSAIVLTQLGLLALASSWLGAGVFGKELSRGLLAFTLAHTESRREVWAEKMRTSGLLVGTLLCLSMGTVLFLVPSVPTHGSLQILKPSPFLLLLAIASIISISGMAGGAYYSLGLRSYQGAFWMTLLLPVSIATLGTLAFALSPINNTSAYYERTICTIILLYGLGLLVLAKRKFLNWQDLGTWGGEIWLSSNEQSTTKETPSDRRYRPVIALWQKEIHFQYLNILVAAALVLLYSVSINAHELDPKRFTEAGLLAFFARALLLGFLPLAIGSTAIAEERRLHLDLWQLSLPSSNRTQWIVKLVSAYSTTAIIAVLIPLLIDSRFVDFWSKAGTSPQVGIMLAILSPFLATSVGLYASSLSRSFLMSLGNSALTIVGLSVIWLAGMPQILDLVHAENTADPRLLFAAVMVTLFLPALLFLCYINYTSQRQIRSILIGNLITWISLTIMTIAFAKLIYTRAWDRFTHRPPSQGPAVLSPDVKATIIPNTWLTVLAPNGTLWTSELRSRPNGPFTSAEAIMTQIGTDSDWVRAYSTFQNLYFIKRDGRLYRTRKFGPDAYRIQQMPNPNPQSGWRTLLLIPGNRSIAGFQADGSLWNWKEKKDGSISPPEQILPEHRWKSVARDSGNAYVGVKADGSMWAWGSGGLGPMNAIENPLSAQIEKEMQILFYSDGRVGPPDPEALRLYEQHEELLTQLKVPMVLNYFQVHPMNEISWKYRQARTEALKVYETPYRITTRDDWHSVAFSDRLPGHWRPTRLLERVLLATRTDDSVWIPTACAEVHWNIDTKGSTDPLYNVSSALIPKQIVSFQAEEDLGLATLNQNGTLSRPKWNREGRFLTVDLSKSETMLSERDNWLSFTRSFHTTVAISDDGLLWHGGPHPLRGQPNQILQSIIPANLKLKPVFDFRSGKSL